MSARGARAGRRRGRRVVDPRLQLQVRQSIKNLTLTLFGLSSPASLESLARLSRAQIEKYGHLGLRAVPVDDMPAAVDALFARFNLRAGDRLLEIGPGPHGGISLVAALKGLDAVVVEYERTFTVDVDLLKEQLSASAGTEPALAQLAGVSGSIEVSQIDNLNKVVAVYQPLIAAVGGSLTVIPGDFADAAIQDLVREALPVDHVICTDVISPMQSAHSHTTAMLTTGEEAKIQSMLAGLASVAADARTLYIGLIVPEQSDKYKDEIARLYGLLESSLREHRRAIQYDHVISPSSATVMRSRLYQLGGVM